MACAFQSVAHVLGQSVRFDEDFTRERVAADDLLERVTLAQPLRLVDLPDASAQAPCELALRYGLILSVDFRLLLKAIRQGAAPQVTPGRVAAVCSLC
jgi:hypothetical protein